jgi:hypothetical protein
MTALEYVKQYITDFCTKNNIEEIEVGRFLWEDCEMIEKIDSRRHWDEYLAETRLGDKVVEFQIGWTTGDTNIWDLGYDFDESSVQWPEPRQIEKPNFIPVKILQDDSSHNYIVPNDLAQDFDDLCYNEDKWDKFEDKFSKYMTGGSPNNYQLYISQEELNKLINET